MKCEECKYWEETENCPEDGHIGSCRRFAPQVERQESLTTWPPETYADEWCGQFEAKEVPGQFPTWTDMCWSVRCRNVLEGAGIGSVKELLTKTPEDLLRLGKFGRRSLREVQRKLEDYNLILKA